MHSTLSDLSLYDAAYELKRDMYDELFWINGMYTLEALNVVISNVLSAKGASPKSYRDKPILMEVREKTKELSQEEKQEQIDILFGNLSLMQKKFEKNKENNKRKNNEKNNENKKKEK